MIVELTLETCMLNAERYSSEYRSEKLRETTQLAYDSISFYYSKKESVLDIAFATNIFQNLSTQKNGREGRTSLKAL